MSSFFSSDVPSSDERRRRIARVLAIALVIASIAADVGFAPRATAISAPSSDAVRADERTKAVRVTSCPKNNPLGPH